ncbi:proteoglycan 4-like [Schistocerca serialis cubense]|uniref:proteoglycan 4-like n=1 Tax=Schistocerca serialis cubense TaxID=2023355 RepID=UPI00214E30C8|nr:proteoglycan 4-like [Schistocerca serialis cubense]
MNRMAKATTVPEREAAEKVYEMFVCYDLATVKTQRLQSETSMLPSELLRSATEEEIVPPGALLGAATQDVAAPAEAAPIGVAPPDLATQEASAPLVAQTDDPSQEAASSPVLAAQGQTDCDHPVPKRPTTTPDSLEIPEANLETLLSAEMPMEEQQALRKRPATSDSDEQSVTTAPDRRQTKKKAATTDAPTAPPAADEDGFTARNQQHTAKPKRLEHANYRTVTPTSWRPPPTHPQPPTKPEITAAGPHPPPTSARAEDEQPAPVAESLVGEQCRPGPAPAPPAPAAAGAIAGDLQTLLQTLNTIVSQLPTLASAAATALQAIAQPPRHG